MIFQTDSATLEIIKGDITEVKADALVNAANNRLYMGGGVAGAMKRKGGHGIEKEAVAKGPIEIGAALTTTAGVLPAKYIIHAAVMGLDFKTDRKKIKKATESAMDEAKRLGVESIAFPALGTGVGGFPFGEAAKIMVQTVIDKLPATSVKKVIFILFEENACQVFLKKATEFFG